MNVHGRTPPDAHATTPVDSDACDVFLQENPNVQYIDCVFADLCGVVRGKRIARAELESVFRSGLQIPRTIYFLDARGDAVDAPARTSAGGEPSGTAWPVPGTLTRVNWSQRPHGQVLMTLTDAKAKPYFGEPRNVLQRVISRFADLDLAADVSAFIEFSLMDRERTKAGLPQQPAEGADRNRFDEVLADIAESASAQLVPVTAPESAASPEQFGIGLKRNSGATQAGDHIVFLRQVVRAVARQNGLDASFMAKPFLDRAGNGMHIMAGINHRNGRSVFDDGTAKGSDLLRHAVGGLQAVMAESIALFAPNVNAYRRFGSNSAAPRNKRWGYATSTANIRAPGGQGAARRIEHRVAGADANPYLVLAAVLAGIHHGISGQLDPGPPFEGNAASFVDQTLPFNIDAALVALENGSIMREYLGPAYVDVYCAAKRTELERFRNLIPANEYDWYL